MSGLDYSMVEASPQMEPFAMAMSLLIYLMMVAFLIHLLMGSFEVLALAVVALMVSQLLNFLIALELEDAFMACQ